MPSRTKRTEDPRTPDPVLQPKPRPGARPAEREARHEAIPVQFCIAYEYVPPKDASFGNYFLLSGAEKKEVDHQITRKLLADVPLEFRRAFFMSHLAEKYLDAAEISTRVNEALAALGKTNPGLRPMTSGPIDPGTAPGGVRYTFIPPDEHRVSNVLPVLVKDGGVFSPWILEASLGDVKFNAFVVASLSWAFKSDREVLSDKQRLEILEEKLRFLSQSPEGFHDRNIGAIPGH